MSVSDVASLAVAAGTLVLAFFTWRSVKESKNEASATNRLADEAKTDRELAWAPVLGLPADYLDVTTGSTGSAEFDLINVGGGPALGTRYLRRNDDKTWFLAGPIALASQGKDHLDASRCPFRKEYTLLVLSEPPYGIGLADIVGALFCEDVFANRYRFVVSNPDRLGDRVSSPQIWRAGSAPRPQWADVASFWGS